MQKYAFTDFFVENVFKTAYVLILAELVLDSVQFNFSLQVASAFETSS